MTDTTLGIARATTAKAAAVTQRLLTPEAVEDPTRSRQTVLSRWRKRWVRLPSALRRLSGPVLLLVAWFSLTASRTVSEQELSSPKTVWNATEQLLRSGELQHSIAVSLVRVFWGLLIGVAIGLTLALVAGFFQIGEDAVDSSMNVLRMVPVVTLLPLIVLWAGIGEPAKVLLIVLGTIFPVYMNTFAAIRGVDQKLIEAGRAFGLGRIGLIRQVVIPGSIHGFLVGLRWAIGSAWLLLYFAEQLNTHAGIGYLIVQAQQWNRTDIIMMGIIVYGILGFLSDGLVRVLERVLLRWRRGFEGT